MFFRKKREELALVRAFQEIFFDDDGKLSKDGGKVLAFFRDEAGARGELGKSGVPYFYDAQNRFDANAAAFLLGKRRMFDLMVKYLALDEREVFRLTKSPQRKSDDVEEELDV